MEELKGNHASDDLFDALKCLLMNSLKLIKQKYYPVNVYTLIEVYNVGIQI